MPGPLFGATIAAVSLDAAVAAYSRFLGYRGERGVIDTDLAIALGQPELTGRAMATLFPETGERRFIRLVEGSADPAPLTRFGWSALELIVRDLDGLAARLIDSPFRILGAPATLDFDFTDQIRAMQVAGPSGEILYLTEVTGDVPGFDLPRAECDVGPPFIAVAGVPDLDAWIETARQKGLLCGPIFESRIDVLSNALQLPLTTRHQLTTAALGSATYLEIDYFPAPAHASEPGEPLCGIIAVAIGGEVDRIGPLRFQTK